MDVFKTQCSQVTLEGPQSEYAEGPLLITDATAQDNKSK